MAQFSQRLDSSGRGAGADGDQGLALLADLADPLGVVGGGDRALDQADVVGPGDLLRPGLQEVGDLDGVGHGQQLVLRVQQGELAAVARGKLEDGQFGLGHG